MKNKRKKKWIKPQVKVLVIKSGTSTTGDFSLTAFSVA
jgi:hypothetical protein